MGIKNNTYSGVVVKIKGVNVYEVFRAIPGTSKCLEYTNEQNRQETPPLYELIFQQYRVGEQINNTPNTQLNYIYSVLTDVGSCGEKQSMVKEMWQQEKKAQDGEYRSHGEGNILAKTLQR